MSGLEILGAIGSAISVLEGIMTAKSYFSDVRHSTRDKKALEDELQIFERLVKSLEEFIPSLPQDDTRDSLSKAFEEFSKSVSDIQKAVRGSSKPWMWKFDKVKVKELLDRLERLRGLLNLSLTSYNIRMSMNQHSLLMNQHSLLMNGLDGITKNTDTVKVLVEIERLHAIQNWLTSNYLLEDELSEIRRIRASGSGEWLLQSDEFRRWLAGTERVLALKGPPGCGKTILSLVVTDYLEELDATVFPVFIQHSSNITKKTILTRILSIALGLSDGVPSKLLHLYQRQKLEEADIRTITSNFLSSMNGPLYIVLDALDEFSSAPRPELISLLLDLAPHARLFITMRPLAIDPPHISISLKSSNLRDLKAFVQSEVDNLLYAVYGDSEDVDELKKLVIERSSEIFLLSGLHIRELKGCLDMDDALEVAAKLPTTDSERYSRSIERIHSRDPRRATTANHCLVWVWQAKRRLTLDELQTAVASSTRDLTNRSVNRALVPRHQLLDLCDGLLVMNENDGYVTFVHLTTRQYFDKHAGQPFLDIIPQLATGCLGYLNALHSQETVMEWSANVYSPAWCKATKGHGFFDYACRYWGDHVPLADSIQSKINALKANNAILPIATSIRSAHLFQGMIDSAPQDVSWKHIAASFGLIAYLTNTNDELKRTDSHGLTTLHYAVVANHQNAILELLQHGVSPECRDSKGQSPLMYAAHHGHIDIVHLLLGRDDVDADAKNKNGMSALMDAAHNGHIDIVHLLLGRDDVDADAKRKDGSSALIDAAYHGYTDIVHLLLRQGNVDINAQNNYGWSALMVAAQNGHIDIVHLLLGQDNIDADAKNKDEVSALMIAGHIGHIDIAHLLLRRDDVDANAKTKDGSSALIYAAYHGCIDFIHLLLGQDNIDINAQENYGWSALMVATQNGQVDMVQLLLKQNNVDVNVKNQYGLSTLTVAAQNGHIDIVHLLLGRDDVDADAKSKNGVSALMAAAYNGHIDIVCLLLGQDDVDANAKDKDGSSALIDAAHHGHIDIVQLLLGQGNVDVNAQNKNGWSALMVATQNGQIDIVQLLLEQGNVDINAQNNYGWSALTVAALNGHVDIVHLFLRQDNVEADAKNKDGVPALMIATQLGHIDIVHLLLGRDNVDANAKSKDGVLALMVAAHYGHIDIVHLLLGQDNVDVNAKDKDGWSALMIAAQNSHIDIVHLLLGQDNVDVNAQNKNGWSALMVAAKNDQVDIVQLLLGQNNVDDNVKNKDGMSALMVAAQIGHVDVNAKDQDGWSALMIAAQNSHIDIVHLLLGQDNVEVDAKNKDGVSALMIATLNGNIDIFRLFLGRDDVDADAKSKDGWSALMVAAQIGHIDIVHFLLRQENVEADAKNKDGVSALMIATLNGHIDIFQLFLGRDDVDADAKSKDGWSALMFAAQIGHIDIVHLLLQQGNVDINAQNNYGWSALMSAVRFGHMDVVKLLLRALQPSDIKPISYRIGTSRSLTNLSGIYQDNVVYSDLEDEVSGKRKVRRTRSFGNFAVCDPIIFSK